MRTAAQKLAHLIIQPCGVGDKIRLHRHFVNVKLSQIRKLGIWAADQTIHLTCQILGMNDADDVFRIIFVNWEAGMRAFQTLGQNRLRIIIRVDHFDARTVQHDFFDRAVG